MDFIEILTALSDNDNMGTAPKGYDVDWETQFTRDKLQTAIPNRLQELYDIILSCKSKGTAEPWFADLVVKILLSVNRVCGDLLKTIDQDAVSGAAWNSRNLLELWVWLKYCATSQENARRFYEDALRDMQGLTDALSKLHALQGIGAAFDAETPLGFPLITAASTHPPFVPTGLSVSQLIQWLLCAKATQQGSPPEKDRLHGDRGDSL